MRRPTAASNRSPIQRKYTRRSLHATADIFAALKRGRDEPSAAAAAAVGLPPGADGALGAAAEAVVNAAAVDFLRRLPGVTDGNFRQLMAAAGSLAGLAGMSLGALEGVIGGAKAAAALHSFLHAPCPRL